MSGCEISLTVLASGSTSVTLASASRPTAPAPPSAPRNSPSSTNGQRMNQSVAPTSFITSTSRRRENSDRRIVLEISSIDANTSSAASSAIVILITRVADRIWSVCAWRFWTAAIAGSVTRRMPSGLAWSSSARNAPELSGRSGVTRKMSGSGL